MGSRCWIALLFFSLPFSTKANLNLRQTGLKDLGIKEIKWLLSGLKPPPTSKCQTSVVQYHLTLDHVTARWRARITGPDRSDSRRRIHPRLARSKLTPFKMGNPIWFCERELGGHTWREKCEIPVGWWEKAEGKKIWRNGMRWGSCAEAASALTCVLTPPPRRHH